MKSKYKENSSTYDLEALKKEWREQMFRIAATEYAEKEAEDIWTDIIAEEASGATREMDAHLAKTQPQTLKTIRNALFRGKVKKVARQTLPRIGQAVAVMIAVLSISLSVAAATIHTVRVRVLEFLVNIEEQYTELSLREDPVRSFDIPADWEGDYYPSEMPEGFIVSNVIKGTGRCGIDFVSQDDKKISIFFSEHTESSFTNLDTENSQLSAEIVNGVAGLVSSKLEKTSISWSRDSRYFVLICYGLTKDEALKIANSVIRVK